MNIQDFRSQHFSLPLAQRAPRLRMYGSMVLYRYCVSFFRPAGRKNDTQEIENGGQAKVLNMRIESGL